MTSGTGRFRLTWPTALSLAVVLLALCCILPGCPRPDDPGNGGTPPVTPDEPFRITFNTWVGFAPLYLAQEKGLFEQNGVPKVEIVRIEDAGARKSSMLSGRIEGYASSIDNWALDSAQGVEGKIVLAFDESAGGDGIVARKDTKTVADLKGQTVGVQPGMPGQFLLFYIMEKNGLKPADIKTVDMDSDKAGAAFVANKIDAAVTWEPWLSKAAEANGHVLVSTKDNPGLIVDVLVAPEKVLNERRAEVEGVVKAWFAALDYWQANKSEADQIMATALGLQPDEFAAMCEGVNHMDLAENRAYFGTAAEPGPAFGVYDSAGKIWSGQGIIQQATQAASQIDTSVLEGIK